MTTEEFIAYLTENGWIEGAVPEGVSAEQNTFTGDDGQQYSFYKPVAVDNGE